MTNCSSMRLRIATMTAVSGLTLIAADGVLAADQCSARSARTVTPVVELYTSEGCNSCPPADRWLSTLKREPNVVALAFHVDYWDRLGWKDRFADAAFTARQSSEQRHNGARFSYTPQVVVGGVDSPNWPQLRTPPSTAAAPPMSAVDVSLQRDGNHVLATVAPQAGSPHRLAAYWAVTEQGHASAVKAGENQGVTLNHDFVVRAYQPVSAWTASIGQAETLRYDLTTPSDPAHPRSVNLVVLDAESGKPVQALKLGC